MSLRKLFLVASLLLWMVGVADAQTLRVTAERTNLRDKPATDGAVVAGVVKGDQLTVVERTGSWYRVRTASGTEGYVSSLLVEVVSAAAPAPAAMTPAVQAPAAPTPPPPAAPAPSPRPAPAQTPAPPPVQVSSGQSDRSAVVRVMGGLLTGYSDAGFIVGAGVGGLHPFGGDKIELGIDGFLGRSSSSFLTSDYSTTVIAGSGTVYYNFVTPGAGFTPFVGAGITVARASTSVDFNVNLPGFEDTFGFAGTSAGFHVAAGIRKPLGDRRAFRAEARSAFYSYGGTFLILAGIEF